MWQGLGFGGELLYWDLVTGGGPGGPTRAQWGAHKGPRGAHKRPSGVHKGPRGAHKGPKGGPQGPKGAHKDPRGAHNGPRGSTRAQVGWMGRVGRIGCAVGREFIAHLLAHGSWKRHPLDEPRHPPSGGSPAVRLGTIGRNRQGNVYLGQLTPRRCTDGRKLLDSGQ